MFLGLGLRFGGSGVAGASGGFSLDSNLPTPTLSLAVGKTTYPPQFSASFTGGFYAGDQIEFWSAASYAALATAMASTGTLLDDDDDNGLVDATLSGIASGLTYAAVRLRLPSNSTYGPTSNIILHGDVTAPTITSSAAVSNNEGSVLAHTLTANETIYTWTITGGVDSGDFEIAGTTLRWLGDGTKDYETPTDSGTNNVYDVQVTATDYAGNATNQSIAVTVTDQDEIPSGLTGFFTDVTGASLSTLYTAAETYTVAGLASGISVPITVSQGSYSKNGAGYTAGAGTVTNGDTVELQVTSSAIDGGVASVVLTIGGGSDTWLVTNINTFDPASIFGGSDDGYYFKIDPTTCFSDTALTTSASVNGAVKSVTDLSGKGHHLVWVSGNTLTLRQSGSLYWLEAGASTGITGNTVTLTQPWYRISAIRIDSWTAFLRVFGPGTSSHGQIRQNGSANQMYLNDGSDGPVVNPTLGTDYVVSELHDNTNSTLELNSNGAATGTSGTQTGDGHILFNVVSGASAAQGLFYGDLAINRDPTSGEKASLKTFFAALYGGTL